MTEIEKSPKRIEKLRTLEFGQFKPHLLDYLTNWKCIELEPEARWHFVHKEYDTQANDYYFEVKKPWHPEKGTFDSPQVSFVINNEYATLDFTLLDARTFSIGTVGEKDLPTVIFKGLNKSVLEIRNEGEVLAKKLSHAVFYTNK